MISRWSRALGLDWEAFYTGLKGLRRFWTDYRQIVELNVAAGQAWKIRADYPCLHDFYGPSGVARGHYFHQDLHVHKKFFKRAPSSMSTLARGSTVLSRM
jgi:hypothetical protein